HDDQEHQVEQHEQAAAVLPHQEREAPHVPDADRTARADQDEAQPRAKGFTFHDFPPKQSTYAGMSGLSIVSARRTGCKGEPGFLPCGGKKSFDLMLSIEKIEGPAIRQGLPGFYLLQVRTSSSA